MHVLVDHPRPQLVRPHRQDLCGEWEFAFDDSDAGLDQGWATTAEPFDRTIQVPYPFESRDSGIHDSTPHPVVWYRRTVRLDPPAPGHRLVLHFGAVDHHATVWLDGARLGEHRGGHTPFALDATDAFVAGADQVLVVRAEDRLDAAQPRGKQGWRDDPHVIFYHRTTGIWQPVWAETVPARHIRELHWTPDVAGASVRCEVDLSRPPATDRPLRVRVRLSTADGTTLADQTVLADRRRMVFDVAVPALRHEMNRDELLWSPERPNLVDATVEVLDGGTDGGTVVDTVDSYLGLREIRVEDGRFLLNNRPVFLRLALSQGYWPDSHLAAPAPDGLRREAELAKELGFNGIRIHQKIEDPRFLAWCDRIGLLVWAEMPSAYEFGPDVVEQVAAEWLESVRRDRSHPSIVTWVPMNESWGVSDAASVPEQQHHLQALYHLTKAVDGSRPVISNDGWEHARSDIVGVHDYAPHGDLLRERYGDRASVERALDDRWPGPRRVHLRGHRSDAGAPVVLTEFGGLSFAPAADESWFGYATVTSPEELEERLRGLFDAVHDSPDLAGFCYTQLTDTEQERNGLVTEDRKPKLPVDVLRDIITRPSQAVPTEATEASRRVAPTVA
ncbi:glycoside hydrolase [Pseudonocardia sp. HH130630-07]|nr:glycoside hydrolase [Pseudonocardia sp. HH130630-07]